MFVVILVVFGMCGYYVFDYILVFILLSYEVFSGILKCLGFVGFYVEF